MVPKKTPCITKKQKNIPPRPRPLFDHSFTSSSNRGILPRTSTTTSAAQKFTAAVGGFFTNKICKNMVIKLDHFPKLRDEHEKYCKPPPRFRYMKQWYDECTQNLRIVVFSPERSLIIKDMLGIYIVYIKPMTIRSWIPFEAKHIGCMHATVKCQNHWSTNFFTVICCRLRILTMYCLPVSTYIDIINNMLITN